MSLDEWERLKGRSPVRVQWDPERDLLQPLEQRAIQIGLSKEAIQRYVGEWIQKVTDITPLAHTIHSLVSTGNLSAASYVLPNEEIYSAACA